MSANEDRVPGWPDYLAQLKEKGIWQIPENRNRAISEWEKLYREQCARDEAPIVADLNSAGVHVDSIWDIVNSTRHFPSAIPILLMHLRLKYPTLVREGLARAIAEPAARYAWEEIKGMYLTETDWQVRDALAVALAGAAGDAEFDDLVSLSTDKNLGGRALLLMALDRSKNPRAEEVLRGLENDDDVRPTVQDILKRRARRKK